MDEYKNSLNTDNNSYSTAEDNISGFGEAAPQKKRKSFVLKAFGAVFKTVAPGVLCLCLCFAVGAGAAIGAPKAFNAIKSAVEEVTAQKTGNGEADEGTEASQEDKADIDRDAEPLAYASATNVELIKKVKKSVVCIVSTSEGRDVFNIPYESSGAGSGIIFSEDDNNVYIVTNNHVIDGAKKITISFDSENVVPAEIVGTNEINDLAVISVSADDLKANDIDYQAIVFGNSDEVKEGSSVIAVGNALGEGNTATSGVVSVVNKELSIDGKKLQVIQTDAAINPGNSGGALINSRGEVIGINTAKYSKTEVEGIGYSITSNSAKPVIEKIMNNETTPILGVYVADITEEMLQSYDLPNTGVILTQIISGSSAEKAGLMAGDIVTGIDSKPIFNKEQLVDAISSHRVGDKVELKIIRENKNKTVTVELFSGES